MTLTFTMDHAAVCFALAIAFTAWACVDVIWFLIRRDHYRMLWALDRASSGWRCGAPCGAWLRYESTANGLEYWRCPVCHNPYWWLA